MSCLTAVIFACLLFQVSSLYCWTCDQSNSVYKCNTPIKIHCGKDENFGVKSEYGWFLSLFYSTPQVGIFTSFTLLLIVPKVGIIGFGVNITLVVKVIVAMFKRQSCLNDIVGKQTSLFISALTITSPIWQGYHNWVFCKYRACNLYGFLHLDCHEFSLNELNAKIIGFRTSIFKFWPRVRGHLATMQCGIHTLSHNETRILG